MVLLIYKELNHLNLVDLKNFIFQYYLIYHVIDLTKQKK
jgi:hypothetical protein